MHVLLSTALTAELPMRGWMVHVSRSHRRLLTVYYTFFGDTQMLSFPHQNATMTSKRSVSKLAYLHLLWNLSLGSISDDHHSARKRYITLSVEWDWNPRYVDVGFDATWLVGSSDSKWSTARYTGTRVSCRLAGLGLWWNIHGHVNKPRTQINSDTETSIPRFRESSFTMVWFESLRQW